MVVVVVDRSAKRERSVGMRSAAASHLHGKGGSHQSFAMCKTLLEVLGPWRGSLAHVGSGRNQKITRIQNSSRRDVKPQSWREAKNDMTTVYSFTIALACAPPSEFQGLAVGKIYRGRVLSGPCKCRCH